MSRRRPATSRTKSATASSPMTEQEELRDDVPPADPDDDRLEEGNWEETESTPHAGEEGQEPI
jgi:hypothetical protein